MDEWRQELEVRAREMEKGVERWAPIVLLYISGLAFSTPHLLVFLLAVSDWHSFISWYLAHDRWSINVGYLNEWIKPIDYITARKGNKQVSRLESGKWYLKGQRLSTSGGGRQAVTGVGSNWAKMAVSVGLTQRRWSHGDAKYQPFGSFEASSGMFVLNEICWSYCILILEGEIAVQVHFEDHSAFLSALCLPYEQ